MFSFTRPRRKRGSSNFPRAPARGPSSASPCCPHCGSLNVNLKSKHKTMPFRCREKGCYKQFSVKVGTFMHSSPIDYVDWILTHVLYLVSTNLKGVSSMRLHRDLGRTQKTAWHVAHRVRKLMGQGKHLFSGPIECDETFIGGKRKNMRPERRKQLTGRGPVGKVAIAGIRDRATKQVAAQPVPDTTSETLSGFIAGPGGSWGEGFHHRMTQ